MEKQDLSSAYRRLKSPNIKNTKTCAQTHPTIKKIEE
ncbi:hypothetical protein IGI79_001782 [Enterococcus sp. AZ084]